MLSYYIGKGRLLVKRRYSPEDYGSWNAELDKDLLDVIVQCLLI